MAGFVVMHESQEEYDAKIRAKAIEEFAEAMKKKSEHYEFANFLESSWSHAWAILHFKSCVDKIAKELKGE